jgi:hypothetical protein
VTTWSPTRIEYAVFIALGYNQIIQISGSS